MNLISFNIEEDLLNKRGLKTINKKKNLLFHHSCLNNKLFGEKKINHLIADVHVIKNKRFKKKKIKFIEQIFYQLLGYLTKKLNKTHGLDFEKTYWKILIGKWLYTLVYQSYLNWEILKKIEKKYEINFFFQLDLKENIFIPENTLHSHTQVRGQSKYNLFHHWLISKMVDFRDTFKVKKIYLKKNLNIEKRVLELNKPLNVQNVYYKGINNKIFYYLWDVPKIIKLYLMKKYKFINLNLKKKEVNEFLFKEINREKLFKFKGNNDKKFISFMKSILQFVTPKIFLENFNSLEYELSKLKWPKKPKIILTSYPYYEEIFKYYCAKNKILGTKVIITQHGYDNIFKYEDWFPNKIYDDFQLSWGTNKKRGLKEFFFTKIFKKKEKFYFKKKNKILFILYALTEMEERLPDGYISNNNINKFIYNSTSYFLKKINKDLYRKIEIKSLQLTKFSILNNSLKKKFNNLKFLNIEKPFINVIDKYNLSVHFFLGTPFFESLYLNRPCILILNKEIQLEFDKNFSDFISIFIKKNICFEDLQSAVNFININYDNIDKWWNKSDTQATIDKFCKCYCKRPENLAKEFRKLKF